MNFVSFINPLLMISSDMIEKLNKYFVAKDEMIKELQHEIKALKAKDIENRQKSMEENEKTFLKMQREIEVLKARDDENRKRSKEDDDKIQTVIDQLKGALS